MGRWRSREAGGTEEGLEKLAYAPPDDEEDDSEDDEEDEEDEDEDEPEGSSSSGKRRRMSPVTGRKRRKVDNVRDDALLAVVDLRSRIESKPIDTR